MTKSRQNSNVPNRLSITDRTELRTKIGTREGEVILQRDIGQLYTWTTTQGTDDDRLVINVSTGSWEAGTDVMLSGYVGIDGIAGNYLPDGVTITKGATGLFSITHNLGILETHIDPLFTPYGVTTFPTVMTYSTNDITTVLWKDHAGTSTDTAFYFSILIPKRSM